MIKSMETKSLTPVQPYLLIQTESYKRLTTGERGISHFYEFTLDTEYEEKLQAVPDGSVDLLFGIGTKDIRTYIGGTVLKVKKWPMESDRLYFGVRFKPGKCILPKGLSIEDVVNNDLEIDGNCYGTSLLCQMEEGKDIRQRAHIFMENYMEEYLKADKKDIFERLEDYVRNRIYETKGNISIKELAKETGYSECYIRRVFGKIHGISPKVFEKFVRFQNALDKLNQGGCRLDELALKCGYYDQSHMIKDFKAFCGVTPEAYAEMIKKEESEGYGFIKN